MLENDEPYVELPPGSIPPGPEGYLVERDDDGDGKTDRVELSLTIGVNDGISIETPHPVQRSYWSQDGAE